MIVLLSHKQGFLMTTGPLDQQLLKHCGNTREMIKTKPRYRFGFLALMCTAACAFIFFFASPSAAEDTTPSNKSGLSDSLGWFARHQSPNGMWDIVNYPANCTENPKCEPGTPDNGVNTSIAITGYVALCYLDAGYDHKTPNRYKSIVDKALEYLRSVQSDEGLFGKNPYEHAVATTALAEAYAMTNDPNLKVPAQKGLAIILNRQNQDTHPADPTYTGLGWDSEAPSDRNDSRLTTMNIMAIRSGLVGGLGDNKNINLSNGLKNANNWLQKAWEACNPNFRVLTNLSKDESNFPYTYNASTQTIEKNNFASAGALSAVFLGHHSGDIMLETLCNRIMSQQFPSKFPSNTLDLYFNTLAIFQLGGERWAKWRVAARKMLLNNQRKGLIVNGQATSDGCLYGSWNSADKQIAGNELCRPLNTAFCTLTLVILQRSALVEEHTPVQGGNEL
jgi:A-macroglobulin TED domain